MNASAKEKLTHIESLVEKDYLGAWDFEERDYTLVIAAVEQKEIRTRGGKKSRVPVITFERARKKFILTARTNRDAIKALYGPYIERWIGKALTLYCDYNCKNPEGKGTVPGIRIRPEIPKRKGEVLPERPVNEEMRAKQNEAFERAERDPGEEG